MQWLSIHRPHTARYLHDQAEAVLMLHRPKATAMAFTLSSQMEYTSFDLYNPAVILNPDLNRLNRKIHDMLPGRLMELFDRTLHRARKTSKAALYTFPVNGKDVTATIDPTTRDRVIVNVATILTAAIACV